MKELQNKFSISYNWWRINGEEIQECDVAELNEKAMDIILFQLSQGYVEGEMNASVHCTINGYSGGDNFVTSSFTICNDYRGYWKKE